MLGGCGFGGAGPAGGGGPLKKIRLSTPYSVSQTVQNPGTFTPAGPNTVTVKGQISKGTFSAKLPNAVNPTPPKKKSAGAAGGGSVKSVSGTFISQLDGTSNFVNGTGDFKGPLVIDFSKGSFGVACLSWESKVSNNGNTETGSFILIGGTKLAARSRFSGTFTGNKTQAGPGQPSTVNGTIKLAGKVGKPTRAMNADCKSLAAQL